MLAWRGTERKERCGGLGDESGMQEEASGRDGDVIRERRCWKLRDRMEEKEEDEEELKGEEKNGR